MDVSAIKRGLALENSHPFIKLEEKMQILLPKSGREDLYRTRQTHSFEVAMVARIIAVNIGFNKIEELENVCKAHDLGHPAFGHAGADFLDRKFKDIGIPEGFSDNNNTFEVIKHNSLEFSDYELASIVKYPNKLYDYQKSYLIPKIDRFVKKESKKWGRDLKRTVACEIMDLADRIAYGTSDIVDSFMTGYTKDNLSDYLLNLAEKVSVNRAYSEVIIGAAQAAKSKNKRLVRSYLLKLEMTIIEDLFWDINKATLNAVNEETFFVLDSICEFSLSQFVRNPTVQEERNECIESLNVFCNYFIENPDQMPSNFFKKRVEMAKNQIDKYRAIRDMIGDSTDMFVLKFAKEVIKKEIIKEERF